MLCNFYKDYDFFKAPCMHGHEFDPLLPIHYFLATALHSRPFTSKSRGESVWSNYHGRSVVAVVQQIAVTLVQPQAVLVLLFLPHVVALAIVPVHSRARSLQPAVGDEVEIYSSVPPLLYEQKNTHTSNGIVWVPH